MFTPGPLQSLRSYHRVYAPFCATVTSLLLSSLADNDTQEEIIYNDVCVSALVRVSMAGPCTSEVELKRSDRCLLLKQSLTTPLKESK